MTTPTTAPSKSEILSSAVVFDNDAVTAAWKSSELAHLQLISTNKQYRAIPKAMWDAILATHLSIHIYAEDFFDCDAFSAVFVGFVLWNYEINGVVRIFDQGGHHSYNAVLVCEDGKTCSWQKIEPQTDFFVDDKPPAGVTLTIPSGTYAATTGFAITA